MTGQSAKGPSEASSPSKIADLANSPSKVKPYSTVTCARRGARSPTRQGIKRIISRHLLAVFRCGAARYRPQHKIATGPQSPYPERARRNPAEVGFPARMRNRNGRIPRFLRFLRRFLEARPQPGRMKSRRSSVRRESHEREHLGLRKRYGNCWAPARTGRGHVPSFRSHLLASMPSSEGPTWRNWRLRFATEFHRSSLSKRAWWTIGNSAATMSRGRGWLEE
jgi:hypothetical protein